MRKFAAFFFAAVLLLACGTVTVTVPTEVPSAEGDAGDSGATGSGGFGDAASPRGAAQDPGLPATFTPQPTLLPPTPYTPRGVIGTTSGGVGVVEGESYVVKRGDTLAEIAAAFGVTVDAIARANGIANIDVIEVGQVLVIPAP